VIESQQAIGVRAQFKQRENLILLVGRGNRAVVPVVPTIHNLGLNSV
jgi:hypothetical protein